MFYGSCLANSTLFTAITCHCISYCLYFIYYTYHNIQHKDINILKKILTRIIFFSTYQSVNNFVTNLEQTKFCACCFCLF